MQLQSEVLNATSVTLQKPSALRNFKELTKMRLAISVVFSAIAGYLLATSEVSFFHIILLSFGGYCMVGASNAFNQVIEKDLDALMKRTQNRPLPTGQVSVKAALLFALILMVLGYALKRLDTSPIIYGFFLSDLFYESLTRTIVILS